MNRRVLDFLVLGLFLLAGCQNIDDYRKERVKKADIAFKKIQEKKFPEHLILSLPFCIELALKHNLDLKVYELKEAVDKEKKTAAVLGMLPDLTITNDVTQRSNEPGASSYSLISGNRSLEPSKSTEPFENRVRIELMFSVIDFGLAFCNSVQQQDRAIITTEQKRRAAQNLILDVTRSYLRVAAAQYAMETTEKMIALSIETENLLQDMAKNKTVPLVRVLEENKKFIVLKKALMEYKRSYQNSCIELRSLMGYYPTHRITVDTSAMDKLTELRIPDIELLEEAALLERPELYQLDIQKHITLVEARKTIIMMFPNVRVFTDFTNSTNPFLYNHSWWELGARASYHLLRIPQQIENYYALDAQEEQIKAQVMALSVGILAQVRIAHANLMEVKERYDLSENLFEVYQKHETVAEIHSKSAGSLSKIELSRIKIETAQRAIERTQALGNYYLSYFRLLNAVGLESLGKDDLAQLKKRIQESINETIEDELENAAEYTAEISEIQVGIDEYNTEITNYELQITNLKNELENSTDKLNSLSSSSESANTDKIADLKEFIEEINEKLVENNNEIVAYKAEIKELETEKGEFITKLKESTDIKDGHYKRLDKYNAAIEMLNEHKTNEKEQQVNPLLEKYDSVMDIKTPNHGSQTTNLQKTVIMPHHGVRPEVGDETLGGQAARSVSNLNMEMQQQSGERNNLNTISSEEYTPAKSNNIIVEAQKDAANNTIDQEAFNPVTQNNITLQTMKDADNNLITGEGYNSNLNSLENAMDNQIQDQMNQSMVQPGRDGN